MSSRRMPPSRVRTASGSCTRPADRAGGHQHTRTGPCGMADAEDGSGRGGGTFNRIRRCLLRPLPLSNGEGEGVEAGETVVAEGDQGRKYGRPPGGVSLLDLLGSDPSRHPRPPARERCRTFGPYGSAADETSVAAGTATACGRTIEKP